MTGRIWYRGGSLGQERSIMDEEVVLCAASAYEEKFYLNPEFDALPESVKQELFLPQNPERTVVI